MRLSMEEMRWFEAACLDGGNSPASELLNVFGVNSAEAVIAYIPSAPGALHPDIVQWVRNAIAEARRRASRPF